jgi:hypothetical protein
MEHRFFLAMAIAAVCFSCSRQKACREAPFAQPVTLVWQSLGAELASVQTRQDVADFFTAHPDVRDLFFLRDQYPSDSLFINQMFRRFSNPHIDTLWMETAARFGDEQALRRELEEAFGRLRLHYPEMPVPKVKTVISGLETDLFVSDTLLIIGLDFYLGEGARFRPNMYQYMQRRYRPEFIAPSVMLLYGMDSRINRTRLDDRTVLADMVSYGKAYYFAGQMLPCVPDSIMLGYTPRELAGSERFEDLIWKRLVEDDVLFSTSHLVKQKYLHERPKTTEVGPECPGRIGTWVGLRMVEKYMRQNPDTSLRGLMALPDAALLFRQSGYRPG